MIWIAHRGNIDGPKPEMENRPEYLLAATEKGYDVEVDVWLAGDKLFLGHDEPQYETNIEFLNNEHFWCHCKNAEALKLLLEHGIHCFFHIGDDVTLTSKNYIWTFPKKRLISGAICVMPEYGYRGDIDGCIGVCSDNILEWEKRYNG